MGNWVGAVGGDSTAPPAAAQNSVAAGLPPVPRTQMKAATAPNRLTKQMSFANTAKEALRASSVATQDEAAALDKVKAVLAPRTAIKRKKRRRTKWLVPLLALLVFVLAVAIMVAGVGMAVRKSLAAALVFGATIAWLDNRKLSIEMVALLVLAILVVSGVLTFTEALSGAGMSSIWLVWVGGVAGAAFDACRLSNFVVARTLAGDACDGEIGLANLLARVGVLTFVASLAIPSAVSRNLFLVPLASRFQRVGRLSEERTEAVAAALIFGATKPGMGVLTGYVTSLLVSDTYAQFVAAAQDKAQDNVTGHARDAPAQLAWSTYGLAMLPVWGLLMGLLVYLSVLCVYLPKVRAADAARREALTPTKSQRRRLSLQRWKSAKAWVVNELMADDFDCESAGVTPFDSLPLEQALLLGPPGGPGGPGTSGRAGGSTSAAPSADTDGASGTRLSAGGYRAIAYLLLAVCAWALLGGTLPGVRVDKGAVGLVLVLLLYAPRPVGVADVGELRTAKS